MFFDVSENVDYGNVPVRFGVWKGLQSIRNGCGLQMDGFSAHVEPSELIFDYFHDFCDFAVVSDGLTLFPEGPRTLRDRPEGLRTVWDYVMLLWWYFRKVSGPSGSVLELSLIHISEPTRPY